MVASPSPSPPPAAGAAGAARAAGAFQAENATRFLENPRDPQQRKPQQRSREITSRYKSITPTPSTPPPATTRRCPSPVINRSLNDGGGKRAVSAERRRSDSAFSLDAGGGNVNAHGKPGSSSSGSISSTSSSSRPGTPRSSSTRTLTTGNVQRLWPVSGAHHNLSSSLQLDHTLKPAENGIRRLSAETGAPCKGGGGGADRKGTPERRRTPVRRGGTDQAENARPVDNVQRWGSSSPKALSRSVDLSSEREKGGRMAGLMVQGRALNNSTTATATAGTTTTSRTVRRTPPIRSLTRSINEGPLPDSPQSVSRHMLSESRGKTGNVEKHSGEENETVSLENLSDCESLSSAGSTVTSSGLVKKVAAGRSRQGDIVGCSLSENDFSVMKGGRRLKSLSLSSGSPSAGLSPGRMSAASSQPPSPSRTLMSASPFRGMPSPSRTRVPTFQLPPSGYSTRASLSSLLHFSPELRKGKKAMTQQEEAQYLRILHNRWLQWCFVNARAEFARTSQKAIAERSIYNAWLQTSELRKSVAMKRIKLQQARQVRKVHSILASQGPQLENWAGLQQEHSIALSGAMEALEAAVLRVPVTAGARGDVQAIRDALVCAVDVMGSVEASVGNLLPKTQRMDGLVSELAEVAKQEKSVLEECSGLLDRIAALEIEERSLRTHFVQLDCEKSRDWIPLRTTTTTTTPAKTC